MAKKKQPQAVDNIWMVSREYDGLAGAGGVKDVVRQSAEAMARAGLRVSVVLPAYGFLEPRDLGFRAMEQPFSVAMPYVHRYRREEVAIWQKEANGVTIILVASPRFREKLGVYTYTDEEEQRNPFHRRGNGHFDFFATNILLQKATLALLMRRREQPGIIHCHDGHTALLPTLINEVDGWRHYFYQTACLVTIHNAGLGYHQDVDDLPFAQAITGLPQGVIFNHLLNGNFNPLLAASRYAVLNTVSENYARELRETDLDALTGWLGHQLLARGVVLEGVTNGINPADYDPQQGKKAGLAAAFNPERGDLQGKKSCQTRLRKLLGKQQAAAGTVQQFGALTQQASQPLLTFIGRLTHQKGVDKLIVALEALLGHDPAFQVVLLGTGDPEIEQNCKRLAQAPEHKGRVCFLNGYDPDLARAIFAAGDFFLIPSQYEPCGLTDFIAQLYGNLPIVHHCGGLVKVEDGKTGFAYSEHSSAALMGAVQKALTLFRQRPKTIASIQRRAIQTIKKHYTWDVVIKRYAALYQQARQLIRQEGTATDKNPPTR